MAESKEDDRKRSTKQLDTSSQPAVPMDPSPTQPDTSPTPTVPAGIGAPEFEDLAADARDEAPAGSDPSSDRAAARLRRGRGKEKKNRE